jgi:hypothetical protein
VAELEAALRAITTADPHAAYQSGYIQNIARAALGEEQT